MSLKYAIKERVKYPSIGIILRARSFICSSFSFQSRTTLNSQLLLTYWMREDMIIMCSNVMLSSIALWISHNDGDDKNLFAIRIWFRRKVKLSIIKCKITEFNGTEAPTWGECVIWEWIMFYVYLLSPLMSSIGESSLKAKQIPIWFAEFSLSYSYHSNANV